MFCPTCQSVMRVNEALCPACGDATHPILATDVVEVIEANTTYPQEALPGGDTAGSMIVPERRNTALVPQGKKQMSLLARIPELSQLAWQQPTVRAAVKTGAGAIMLSLAMRVARQWLLEPRRRAAVTDTLVPTLGELLRPADRERRSGSRHGSEVTETFIYVHVRRTTRD